MKLPPWSVSANAGRPSNAVSKKGYSGVNPLLLELHNLRHGLRSKWWGTFNQWSGMGCKVKPRPKDVEAGQWGCGIVFCKPITKKTIEDDGDETESKFFVMKFFTVFSADQVEGAERLQVRDEDCANNVPNFQPADELIEATGADIRYGGESAFYRRPVGTWPNHTDGDFIQVPHKHRFNIPGSFYETIFHELGHWSEVRLGFEVSYAMGELIAEMSASFLATELGVPQGETFENHAAYIKGWLKEMNNDPSFIFKASSQASKVADYLLGFTKTEADLPEASAVVA